MPAFPRISADFSEFGPSGGLIQTITFVIISGHNRA